MPVIFGTEMWELLVEHAPEGVAMTDNRAGTRYVIRARPLFVFVGLTSCIGWLVDLDDHGFVRTGRHYQLAADSAVDAEAPAWLRSVLETSQQGMFAAGHVRSGSIKRIAGGCRSGRDGDPARTGAERRLPIAA